MLPMLVAMGAIIVLAFILMRRDYKLHQAYMREFDGWCCVICLTHQANWKMRFSGLPGEPVVCENCVYKALRKAHGA